MASLSPESLRYYPVEMSSTEFLNALPSLDPRSVRLLMPDIDFSGLHASVPPILHRLDTVPNASLVALVEGGFPTVVGGNLFIAYSLDRPGPWLDLACAMLVERGVDLTPALTDSAVNGWLPSVQVLCRYGADPSPAVVELSTMNVDTLVVRELASYGGAFMDNLVDSRNWRTAFRAGRAIPPVYEKESFGSRYFELNNIEQRVANLVYGDTESPLVSRERASMRLDTRGNVVVWPTLTLYTLPPTAKDFAADVVLENPPSPETVLVDSATTTQKHAGRNAAQVDVLVPSRSTNEWVSQDATGLEMTIGM